MTAPDIAAIARGLTKAQREAVLWMGAEPRPWRKGAPREVSFWVLKNRIIGDPKRQVAWMYSLCENGTGEKRPGEIWPDTTWHLTPLGLAVREHIIKENGGE